MIIDDFASGSHTVTLASGTDRSAQSGSMLGGNRTTWLWISSHYGHPGSLTVGSGRLILSMGTYVYHRLEVAYGYDKDFSFTPLTPHVLSGHDRFRVNFESNDLPLNFNILVHSRSGATYSQMGKNIDPQPYPFSVDYVFSDFSVNPVNPSDIGTIILIFQAAWFTGAHDFAIQSLEAV